MEDAAEKTRSTTALLIGRLFIYLLKYNTIVLYLLKYNTMVLKLNFKSTLTREGKIHTKGSLICAVYTMLNNSKSNNNPSNSSEVE